MSYAEKMKTSQEYLKNDFDDFGFDTTPATNLAEYLLPQVFISEYTLKIAF